MRRILAGSLTLTLGLLAAQAGADDGWRPVGHGPATPFKVTLGKPIAVPDTASSARVVRAAPDDAIRQVKYHDTNDDPLKGPIVIARAQSTPNNSRNVAPAYTANAGGPPSGEEAYNSGVVTDPVRDGGGGSRWAIFADFPWVHNLEFTGGGRALFESDHGFDNFISPVSSPFFAEDPRSLTELRPIFLWQTAPNGNPLYRGGDVYFAGLQARVAITERLSFVLNKVGWVFNEPKNPSSGITSDNGISEIWLGPKYTFWRDDRTGTLMAAGLTFQVPSGSRKVQQDTGNLSLSPYLTFAQNLNFLPTGWGSFNFMATAGYTFATDSQRTDYFYSTYHLDYDLGGLRKIYPMIELTWVNYTSSGKARDLTFEGRDLFNFGSTGVGGHNDVTLAAGLRYKFNEAIQTGIAAQFPMAGRRDIADFRLTVDMIFRF
jgi:hypothetical protein